MTTKFLQKLVGSKRKAHDNESLKPLAEGSAIHILSEKILLLKRTAIVIGINKVCRMLENKQLRLVILFSKVAHIHSLAQRSDIIPIVTFSTEESEHIARALGFRRVSAIGFLKSLASLEDEPNDNAKAALDDVIAALFRHLDSQNEKEHKNDDKILNAPSLHLDQSTSEKKKIKKKKLRLLS